MAKKNSINKESHVMKFVVSFFLILLCVGGFVYYKTVFLPSIRVKNFNIAYTKDFSDGDSSLLKTFLVTDLRSGYNDRYTKTAAFLFVYQYFTNGGDPYEIFDYIHQHHELSFLNEAEIIYPKVFDDMKNRRVKHVYSDKGMYVFLAYLETLEKHSYADYATQGFLVGQYAKMAFYKVMIQKDKAAGKSPTYPNYTKEEVDNDISRALYFINISKNEMSQIVTSTNISLNETQDSDLLLGLTEYASGLRYLTSLNVINNTEKNSSDIFSFVATKAYHDKNSFYFYASMANASTLLLSTSTTDQQIRNAVYPFLNIDTHGEAAKGIIGTILRSKNNGEVLRFLDLNAYSRINLIAIAKRVPEFKGWLMVNGWGKENFAD